MIKSRAKALEKPMAHQAVSLKHDAVNPIVLDTSDPGCVSADTEFLTPLGWKRIDQYTAGDKVAQFYPGSREIEFVAPLKYIKRPCSTMIAIAPSRGTSQRLSHEHRVLYYDADGMPGVCSAADFMRDLHEHGPNHLRRKFCTTFSVRQKCGTSLASSAEVLRLMVAVIADGHFGNPSSNRCVIRVKKTRKIDRLQELLRASSTSFDQRTCGGDPSFQVFTFEAPGHDKEFGPSWWSATQHQLEVIADELPHWDSAVDPRPSGGCRFSSFIKASAEFAQYAFSAAKKPTSLTASFRDRTAEGRGVMTEYVVHAQAHDTNVGPGRKDAVFEIPNPEGFKYCFEVPTSFLLLRHNGYIFATGNTGKTAVRAWAFASRRRKGGGCMLVLAPRSLLRAAWAADLAKFAPDMVVSVADASNRAAAFAVDADIYVTNHDAVKDLVKMPKPWFKKFSELVIDELPAYKHHTSQRSRAVAKLKVHFKQRKGLTATPTSNGICDIWHQVNLLDDGKALGNSFFAFRNAVCEGKQVGRSAHAIQWRDKEGAEEVVFGLLSSIVVRHKFEDCVDIPPTHTYTVPYTLSPKQRKAYDQMVDHQVLPMLQGGTKVTAIHAASVATKLMQISSGAVYDNLGKYQIIDRTRYETLIDMAAVRKHPLMLFYWEHQRDLLVEEAEKRGMKFCVFDGDSNDVERLAMVRSYQRGDYDVMFGHPQTVAHGLTLTAGTSIIWAGPTYNLEWWKQAGRRQARIGQKEKTEVVVSLAAGTVEERAFELCMGKGKRMTNLLELFESSSPMPVATKVARKLMEAV